MKPILAKTDWSMYLLSGGLTVVYSNVKSPPVKGWSQNAQSSTNNRSTSTIDATARHRAEVLTSRVKQAAR
eukprot:6211891-Pleurochrysis_carterae.AAC.2